jgi:hypothetical protein
MVVRSKNMGMDEFGDSAMREFGVFFMGAHF